MPNLKFLRNVSHKGIILKTGMIVDDSAQGLHEVAQKLVDRGLVEPTNEAATHSAALVTQTQEATPVNVNGGQVPNAARDEARRAQAQAQQVAADVQTQNQVIDQANKEATVKTVQPTPEVIAAEAANIK